MFCVVVVVVVVVVVAVNRVFLAFSNFLEMHALMSNYRIGLLTMKVR